MVWNSAGSTLYKAVERHNNGEMPHDSPPPKPPEHKSAAQCPRAAAQSHPAPPANSLDSLLQDKDFLLLAGLMLLLLHEKADNKLILALAFVMFG